MLLYLKKYIGNGKEMSSAFHKSIKSKNKNVFFYYIKSLSLSIFSLFLTSSLLAIKHIIKSLFQRILWNIFIYLKSYLFHFKLLIYQILSSFLRITRIEQNLILIVN